MGKGLSGLFNKSEIEQCLLFRERREGRMSMTEPHGAVGRDVE